jgi:hypothetical protein
MIETHDIFLRAHTVPINKPQQPWKPKRSKGKKSTETGSPEKWAPWVVCFDTESRIDTSQNLTFGFYRVLELKGERYELYEEGAFYADDLPAGERKILEHWCQHCKMEVRAFPPEFPLYSRSEFVTKVFYKYARKGAMIVGFNLPFDLARIACQWPPDTNGGSSREWSFVLVEYPDGSENKHYPRVQIDPLDSKKAFISFAPEWVDPKHGGNAKPSKINESRFVDLRTLLWSLFNKSYSLKRACSNEKYLTGKNKGKYKGPFGALNLPQKSDDGATGKVTPLEIEYARQDVRCTAALLNACKKEFDRHPIALTPDQAYSPASVAKSYLEAMGIKRPTKKFDVSNKLQGIFMESYMGGRSETRIRHCELPVVPVDFTSEYPSTCALLHLWKIITAERLSFPDATREVKKLVKKITLEDCYDQKGWSADFLFWALVKPNEHIFPVRTNYNGSTANIASSYFISDKPVWMAGPDVIASRILTGKAPKIIKAIRIVPHGKQKGMRSVKFMNLIWFDPYNDDLFCKMIEQRKLNKDNPELCYWLKIFTNAIYGFFVEVNPEPMPKHKPIKVHVYSGEESFIPDRRFEVAENEGRWFAPYLASQITSGGRLLLALLEAEVTIKRNGVYGWADTDALSAVSTKLGGSLDHIPGCKGKRALKWKEVDEICAKFEALNPYDRKAVPGSILNLTDDNFDENGKQRPLLGLSISAKRYTTYLRKGEKITIINPKAHGLGYLYPPSDSPEGWDDDHDAPKWIYEFWEEELRIALKLKRKHPAWLKHPQMMRMTVTTQNVMEMFHNWEGFRPWNFFLLPIIPKGGTPMNYPSNHITLIAPFESSQGKWIESVCTNNDPNDDKKYQLTTESGKYANDSDKARVRTFEEKLIEYLKHPEAKSLAPPDSPHFLPKNHPDHYPWGAKGLLQRIHVKAGKIYHIGKETDRKWEEGDDLESLLYEPIVYERKKEQAKRKGMSVARESLIRQIKKIGIKSLIREGYSKRILRNICRRKPLRAEVLTEYDEKIREYKDEQNGHRAKAA